MCVHVHNMRYIKMLWIMHVNSKRPMLIARNVYIDNHGNGKNGNKTKSMC